MGNEKDFFTCFFIVLAVIVGLLALLMYKIYESHEPWEAFMNDHNCKIVSKSKSKIGVGYGYSASGKAGIVMMPEGGETGYLCDDGVVYYR